jgi:two-component system OmpR family response regulator
LLARRRGIPNVRSRNILLAPAVDMKILVVEDDRSMARLVRLQLVEEGYAVDVVSLGRDALQLAAIHTYDGILLDLGLPDRAGETVLRELRASGSRVPVLILSGRTESDEIVHGLDAGADDYLVKPFANAVLKARVRALIRRGSGDRTELLRCGALTVNRLTREARVREQSLYLTTRELVLLEHLALHAGRVVTRSAMLESLWDLHFDPGTNVVDALVLRVRRKLAAAAGAPQIETVRGAGYRLLDAAR